MNVRIVIVATAFLLAAACAVSAAFTCNNEQYSGYTIECPSQSECCQSYGPNHPPLCRAKGQFFCEYLGSCAVANSGETCCRWGDDSAVSESFACAVGEVCSGSTWGACCNVNQISCSTSGYASCCDPQTEVCSSMYGGCVPAKWSPPSSSNRSVSGALLWRYGPLPIPLPVGTPAVLPNPSSQFVVAALGMTIMDAESGTPATTTTGSSAFIPVGNYPPTQIVQTVMVPDASLAVFNGKDARGWAALGVVDVQARLQLFSLEAQYNQINIIALVGSIVVLSNYSYQTGNSVVGVNAATGAQAWSLSPVDKYFPSGACQPVVVEETRTLVYLSSSHVVQLDAKTGTVRSSVALPEAMQPNAGVWPTSYAIGCNLRRDAANKHIVVTTRNGVAAVSEDTGSLKWVNIINTVIPTLNATFKAIRAVAQQRSVVAVSVATVTWTQATTFTIKSTQLVFINAVTGKLLTPSSSLVALPPCREGTQHAHATSSFGFVMHCNDPLGTSWLASVQPVFSNSQPRMMKSQQMKTIGWIKSFTGTSLGSALAFDESKGGGKVYFTAISGLAYNLRVSALDLRTGTSVFATLLGTDSATELTDCPGMSIANNNVVLVSCQSNNIFGIRV